VVEAALVEEDEPVGMDLKAGVWRLRDGMLFGRFGPWWRACVFRPLVRQAFVRNSRFMLKT
jgi:hypothetical protein